MVLRPFSDESLPIMLSKPIILFGTSLKKSKKRQAIASAVAAAVAAVAAAVAHVQHEKVLFWWKKSPCGHAQQEKVLFWRKKSPCGHAV